jgi:acyl-CoA dehydrogenase
MGSNIKQPHAAMSQDHLDWPFLGTQHRELSGSLDRFIESGALDDVNQADVDEACRTLVRRLGDAGILRACVPSPYGGMCDPIDSRLVCLAREKLAYHDGLADFALAMQGLGTGAIGLTGSEELKRQVLPKVASGEWIAAFALSEQEAGSDVAAMQCRAEPDGNGYVLRGEKTWISNGGIADVYTVFARTEGARGTKGISAFVVFAEDKGFSIKERLEVMAPHPLATLHFNDVRVHSSRLLGNAGEGFKIAMRVLDIFRASVGAAAIGFARRALSESVLHVKQRRMFGATLGDLQLTQAKLGDMASLIDAAALLTYRAAWRRDVQKLPTTSEAAMAKMMATENASFVIDQAVQLFGGRGVRVGEVVEKLYREIRALRIYEGATEVQKLIIARELLRR